MEFTINWLKSNAISNSIQFYFGLTNTENQANGFDFHIAVNGYKMEIDFELKQYISLISWRLFLDGDDEL